MKAIKSRVLKKLKSIPQISNLKQDRNLQLKANDGFFFHPPVPPQTPLSSDLQFCRDEQPEIVDTKKLTQVFEDEDENRENMKPPSPSRSPDPWRKKIKEESSPKVLNFRRPDLNSSTLFDPGLLAAFDQAVSDYIRSHEDFRINRQSLCKAEEEDEGEKKDPREKVPIISDLLKEFQEKCPPGGSGAVIFYTTSLRSIRKTFENCSAIRFLLESSKVLFYERDVSMHREFREELKRLLGFGAIPPRLFVDGRYIGGGEEVLCLHEQGRLMPILKQMPSDRNGGAVCQRCGGARFLMCERCDGGRKMYDNGGGAWGECSVCNENGLVICPVCCC
ncbi:hypothetical protein HPP92_015137 [Vanilla planifolia]|uniref:Glutaredoxin domain-containing protein n=1 Tax=Vanilla planifolia TaxID=51239 RepID=A0A835UW06_VANPL|nr:hypothetical protein HPP92_015643 [Vanilla planifolia]KAG0475451.1 hypothetical protein HPP92_015137 [Vanilla planifolia]